MKVKRIADDLDCTPDFILGLTNSPDTRLGTQFDFEHLGLEEPPGGWGYSDDEKEIIEKFKRLPEDEQSLIREIIDYCFNRFIRRINKSE